MNNGTNRGSIWRKWDLQVQTILDDRYISLSEYYESLKTEQSELWNAFTLKVGGEDNAIMYDSKEYFGNQAIAEEERCIDYSRNLFAFIETFNTDLGLIGITDHNYCNPILVDKLYEYSQKSNCKCLCGVEINASGVHMLVFFENPPFSKNTFSEGLISFLDAIEINTPKMNGVLKPSSKSVNDVIKIICQNSGIFIFPHCNSDNGLFQERGRTDRTHLSDMFNCTEIVLLQTANFDSAKKTSDYILSRPDLFKSKFLLTTSPDSRGLIDIGKPDEKGLSTWVKADTTFKGFKQILIEPNRVEISDEPELSKRVKANKTKFIRSVAINKISNAVIDDIWFDNFKIQLNHGLVAIIGNKGGGKSAITDVVSLCGNTYQQPSNFSFLTGTKFRKLKPYNLSERFEASLTWEDGTTIRKHLNENPDKNLPERVKYIPQNFLERLCSNVESEEFEKELKQIIFYHTPIDQRLGKSSLDELISYKSSLVIDEINLIQSEISKLNLQIVFLENKATADYEKSTENQIRLKQDELKAHLTNEPVKPIITVETESNDNVTRLNLLREQVRKLEQEILSYRTNKSVLAINAEELSRAVQHFKNLNDQLHKLKEPSNEFINILVKNNIKIDTVFAFKIDLNQISAELKILTTNINTIEKELNEEIEGSKAFQLSKLNELIKNGQEDLDKPAKEQQKYLDDYKKWNEQKLIIEGTNEIERSLNYFLQQKKYLEEQLLLDINQQSINRNDFVQELFTKKKELTEIRKDLFKPVSQFIDDFKELKERYDVKFDVALEFRGLADNFFSFINQGRIGTFSGKEEGYKKLIEIADKADFNSSESFLSFSNELVENLKRDKRTKENTYVDINTELKSGKHLSDLYDYVYSYDYLQPIYNLKLGDKTLQELSPGERGALLLIFYLILDNDDIPLIIDQPEENLDNESVYHILVHFIKKVKEKRQIIIVTHNPNLAVVCDADQIIHMQIDKKNKNRVNYYCGAIEDVIMNKSIVNVLEGTLPAFNNRDSKYIR